MITCYTREGQKGSRVGSLFTRSFIFELVIKFVAKSEVFLFYNGKNTSSMRWIKTSIWKANRQNKSTPKCMKFFPTTWNRSKIGTKCLKGDEHPKWSKKSKIQMLSYLTNQMFWGHDSVVSDVREKLFQCNINQDGRRVCLQFIIIWCLFVAILTSLIRPLRKCR